MALAELDFTKLKSSQNITVAVGPANAVANVNAPTAAELNAMQNIAHALSWQDFDFGIQASETVNEPSFADPDNYTDFGAATYGGGMSLYYPKKHNDPSNDLSLSYDLTEKPGTLLFIAIRVDGEKPSTSAFVDGDYVHVFLAMTDSETNSIQGAEAIRRTVGLLQQSVFAVYTIVGSLATPPVPASSTLALAAGAAKRIPVTVLGREFTNACDFSTSDVAVARVSTAGVVTAVGAGTADITVSNSYTGVTATVAVTVS